MEEKKNVPGKAQAAQPAENGEEALIEQARIRREKLAKLCAEGKNPYAHTKYDVDADSASVKADFAAYEGKTVSMAGRMMSRRIMGKASFSHIADKSGSIQIYVTRQDIGDENYLSYKKDFDIGDIVGFKGYVFKTQTGEISVHVTELTMLSKALLPLPEKYNGLQNQDLKYRLRHLDLIMNEDVKKTFEARSKILKELRAYLDGKGYLEVDTPVLLTLEIGADARPFKTHHNALDIDMYMRIETELYLKRLIVGGMDRVYEVGRIFRNEGMDAFHNPEFTTIEMYQAYTDYFGMMDLIEDLYKTVTQKVCGTLDITYQGTLIHMGEWTRMTMAESVEKYAGVRFADWQTDEDARAVAKAKGVELSHGEASTKGHVLIDFFDAFVEDQADTTHRHLRLSRGKFPARQAQSIRSRFHRTVRVLHLRPRIRQRLFRAQRPHRPEAAFCAAGGGQARGGQHGSAGGRRFHQRPGIRSSPDGRAGHGRRSSGHALNRQRHHPRRYPFPDDETEKITVRLNPAPCKRALDSAVWAAVRLSGTNNFFERIPYRGVIRWTRKSLKNA